jgi:hypothetical protein
MTTAELAESPKSTAIGCEDCNSIHSSCDTRARFDRVAGARR